VSRRSERLKKKAALVVAALERAYPGATTTALDHRDPYELLVATMLSAQCTDKRVNMVTPALFRRYPDAWALAAAKTPEVESLIQTCGLFRTKARNLVATARALVERHGGEVPDSREALEALPGVGRKTASVVLAVAHETPALAVDTHVHRVANRLGLVRTLPPGAGGGEPSGSKPRGRGGTTREDTERCLTALIPKAKWSTVHHRLIEHGREVCKAIRPRCEACPLRKHCDYFEEVVARRSER
jgi:endonuclease-3